MRSPFSWWPWRRRSSSALQLPPPSLGLLQARVKSLEHDLQASRLREQELLEENIRLAREVAEVGFRADRLSEQLVASMNTKGRA